MEDHGELRIKFNENILQNVIPRIHIGITFSASLFPHRLILQISQSMNFSPLKTSLFQFDFRSSNKKVVSCDINSWMETHSKPNVPAYRPPKNTRPIRISESPSKRTNFQKLKEMRSSLLKNSVRKFSERTPLTAESENSLTASGRNHSSSFQAVRILSIQRQEVRPIKIVEVSEFKEFDSHTATTTHVGAGERKLSLLRLRALSKKGVKHDINHLLLGKEAEIIQNKVTEKQYCGLKFVARKLSAKLRH